VVLPRNLIYFLGVFQILVLRVFLLQSLLNSDFLVILLIKRVYFISCRSHNILEIGLSESLSHTSRLQISSALGPRARTTLVESCKRLWSESGYLDRPAELFVQSSLEQVVELVGQVDLLPQQFLLLEVVEHGVLGE